jgi:hypothetical protein
MPPEPPRRREALIELGVRERLANNTAGSGLGPWYLAKAKALSVGLSNASRRSLEASNKAKGTASGAMTLARGARQEAESADRSAKSAQDVAERERLARLPRHLTPEARRRIADRLPPFSGTRINVFALAGERFTPPALVRP